MDKQVFPTPVGVFPLELSGHDLAIGLPHARGGVSNHNAEQAVLGVSSPRPWGCF